MHTDNLSKRIQYIDIAKCIGMFLVIHNHWALNYYNSEIKIFIASFHMPLFFLLSGLVTKSCSKFEEVKQHMIKKTVVILLPYFLWSFIFCGFSLKKACLVIYGSNISIGTAGGIGGSWFLPCFFVADIVTCIICFWSRGSRKNKALIYAFFVFAISWMLNMVEMKFGFPMSFDVALCGSGFMLIGIYLRNIKIFDKIESSKLAHKICVFLLTIPITALFAFLNVPAFENTYHRLVMALGYYGIYPMFIVGGLIGSVLVITLAMCVQKTKISFFMQRIGGNTYTILLLQQFSIDVIEKLINRFEIKLNFLFPICLSVVCLLGCHFIANFVTKVYPNLKGIGIMSGRVTDLNKEK